MRVRACVRVCVRVCVCARAWSCSKQTVANAQRACGPPPRAARSCRSFVQICTAEIEQCGTPTQLRGIDNTLSSAFSRIAHVLSNTISALDASGAHLRHAIVFGPGELWSSEERSRVAGAAA